MEKDLDIIIIGNQAWAGKFKSCSGICISKEHFFCGVRYLGFHLPL